MHGVEEGRVLGYEETICGATGEEGDVGLGLRGDLRLRLCGGSILWRCGYDAPLILWNDWSAFLSVDGRLLRYEYFLRGVCTRA